MPWLPSDRSWTEKAVPMTHDKVSYLVLFCSLMLIQKSGARLDDIVSLLPSAGPARQLAQNILTTRA